MEFMRCPPPEEEEERKKNSRRLRHGISEESRRRSSKGGLQWRRRLAPPPPSDPGSSREAVRRKVRTLRRLVPGGRRMAREQLLVRTADYIFQLRLQVHVLRALSSLYLPAPRA